MSEPNQPMRQRFEIELPDEAVAGTFADFASLWHTPDVFVLDFAALKGAPTLQEDDDGPVVSVPTRIVARVRIPPSQVFEFMKALEQQLTAWEREQGHRTPEPPVQGFPEQ